MGSIVEAGPDVGAILGSQGLSSVFVCIRSAEGSSEWLRKRD